MAAFLLAVEQGADAIEMDVKLTRDQVPVIMHDSRLDRTTTGSGLVSDHSLREMADLDAGLPFSPDFQGERIPSLERVFQELSEGILLNLELTNYRTPLDDLPGKVLDLCRGHHAAERVLLSSFHPITLLRIAKKAEGLPVGLLVSRRLHPVLRWAAEALIPHDFYHPEWEVFVQSRSQLPVQTSKPLLVWTINDPNRIQQAYQRGVRGVFTDKPALAVPLRDRILEESQNA